MAPPREELHPLFFLLSMSSGTTSGNILQLNARFNDPYRAQRELLSGSKFFAALPPALLNELAEASRLLELPVMLKPIFSQPSMMAAGGAAPAIRPLT